jgi:glucose-1-phosphate adenylyltransferase
MKDIIAIALVGGRGSRLKNITKDTAKPAVSFGGKYRLIDFVLSNVSNSSIDTLGLVTQYEPHDLMKYIAHGSIWDLDVNDGGVTFLTPYTSMNGEAWQKGTAHAVRQHFRFIDQYNPKYVLILSGDHIYKMDYNLMLDFHIDKGADVTIASFKVHKNSKRYGILEVDTNKKVLNFEEKPEFPKSNKASMGVYIFNTEALKCLLNVEGRKTLDFGHDILPLALERKMNVFSYNFDGYFKDVGTVRSLFEANMELIDNPQFLKLQEYVDWPIYTRSSNFPPHHVLENGLITESLVSDGCLINGSVSHCVLSSGVYIDKGSKLRNVVVLSDVRIEENVVVENAIILEGTTIPKNTKLIFDQVQIVDKDYLMKVGESDA